MIYINFVELLSLMLHNKFQNHRPSGSGDEDFKGFCGYLDHVTWTIYINFLSPILRMLHMKFGFDRPSRSEEKIFEIVGDAGRRINAKAWPSYKLTL